MTRVIGIGLIALILFILQRQIYRRIWNRSLYVKVFFRLRVLKITKNDWYALGAVTLLFLLILLEGALL